MPVEPDREMGTAQEGKRCPACGGTGARGTLQVLVESRVKLSGLAGSRQLSTRVRQTSSSVVDKAAAPTPIPAVSGRGAWPLRTLDQILNLLAAYRLPLASAVNLLHSFSRLRIAMQKGTPLGHERRYSWKATAGRSEASSPPTLDHREHSAPSIDDQSDFALLACVLAMLRRDRCTVTTPHSALVPKSFPLPGTAREAWRSPLRKHGGQHTTRRKTWKLARPRPPTLTPFLGALMRITLSTRRLTGLRALRLPGLSIIRVPQ